MRFTAIFALALVAGAVSPCSAQAPFGIMDNSFLVEEAFNQEPGIFQNIFNYRWQRGSWLSTFTQEWPAPNQTHQLSFTLPFGNAGLGASIGDVAINYRIQALQESNRAPAFSPRISIILPSAKASSGLGADSVGWQVNLPFSKGMGDWYFHWNAGLTYADSDTDPMAAGSVIWQASSTLNVMLETVIESADGGAQFTVSPGVRKAWNFGDKQVVVGLAAPVTRSDLETSGGVLAYFSYELPFK